MYAEHLAIRVKLMSAQVVLSCDPDGGMFEKNRELWQLDRTTSGHVEVQRSAAPSEGRVSDDSVRVPVVSVLGQTLVWIPWEIGLASVLLQSLDRFPAWIGNAAALVALNLFTVWFTRMCWLAVRRKSGSSRLPMLAVLVPAMALSLVLLRNIPLGANGHLDWFLATVSVAAMVSIPVFLVVTDMIRLSGTFYAFAIRQVAGFATATCVLLVFLGAYGRHEELFTPQSSVWHVVTSCGLLLVQGIRNLASGGVLEANADATDVLVYAVGWIVFVAIAGIEVSLIADRASEELAEIESRATRVHGNRAKQPESRWRWPRRPGC